MDQASILVVEDDRALGEVLDRVLTSAGFVPRIVRDAKEAVALLGEVGFAAMIVDIGLPSIDGLTLLRHLRKSGVNVPAVVMSGRMGRHRQTEARALRARALQKPFDNQDLVHQLTEAIAKAPKRERKEEQGPSVEDEFRAYFRRQVLRLRNGDASTFPLFDPRLAEAASVLAQEDVSAADVTALIDSDPKVVSEVLRTANSPAFSSSSPVTSVHLASARLGARQVGEIIMGELVRGIFARSGVFRRPIRLSWRRSFVAARLAGEHAPRRNIDGGTAYAAGLLQSVGELAGLTLCAEMAETRELVDPEVGRWGEEEVLRAQQRVGGELLRAWGLPDPLPKIAMGQVDAEWESLLELTTTCHTLVGHVLAREEVESSPLAPSDKDLEVLIKRVRRWARDS
ncbi:MAG: HDOD domain-containing protein [Myxococcota bacterium]